MKRKRNEATQLATAMNHIKSAIDILDATNAPGDIAAHLDLACHRLEGHIERQQP